MVTIHFEVLRRIAETASGMRYQNTWFEVTDTDVLIHATEPTNPTGFVIPCTGWQQPDIPQVTEAYITAEGIKLDLLQVKVPPHELQGWGEVTSQPNSTEPMKADAVFWSASAVEKFLMPYYASTYGSMAPKAVEQLLNVFVPPGSPELEGNAMMRLAGQTGTPYTGPSLLGTPHITITPPADQPFAIVHLPSSEYTAGGPSGGGGDGDALPRLFTVHRSGAVKRLRVEV